MPYSVNNTFEGKSEQLPLQDVPSLFGDIGPTPFDSNSVGWQSYCIPPYLQGTRGLIAPC